MNQSAMRTPFLTRLLARWGRHYLWRVTLALQLTSFLAAGLGIYYIVLNAGLNEGQFVRLAESVFGLVGIANLLVFLYGLAITAKTRSHLAAWAQAQKTQTTLLLQPEQEEAAWLETTAYPWRFTRFSVLVSFFQVIVPAALYLYWTGGFTISQSIHVIIGGAISASGLLLFYYFALERLLEPVRTVLLPSDTKRQHSGLAGVRLHSRLLMVFLAVSMTALLMVSALAYQKALDLTVPGADTAAILRNLQAQLMGVGLAALAFTIGFSYLLARSVSTPINRLRVTMSNVERGQLNQRANVISTDEIGHLGIAFNAMMAQLEILQTHTEQLVAERTQNLERRTNQFRAASYIARQTAELQDIDSILKTIVNIITDQFGFYHAGIFLMNESGSEVVLAAASSEGGKQMIEKGYSLEVGAEGIVGYAAAQKKPRIALDTGANPVFFNNPHLPHTRSEAAVPMMVGDRVIGVLDIQSDQPAAFSMDDLDVLETLASQAAVAIEKMRLLEESQAALMQIESLTASRIREAWEHRARQGGVAYTYTPLGVRTGNKLENEDNALKIPITLRGQKIGVISIARKDNTPWSQLDKEMVQEVAYQTGLALDNMRLIEEATQRSIQEQTVSELALRFSQVMDIDALLQTAARELGQIPDVLEASVFVGDIPSQTSEKKRVRR